jgi:acyl carrier protein
METSKIQQIIFDEVRRSPDLKSAGLGDDDLPSLPLLGRGAAMDSIGLVNLVFSIEERLRGDLGISIEIASERAMSQTKSPFRTVATLVEFVSSLAAEGAAASSAKS